MTPLENNALNVELLSHFSDPEEFLGSLLSQTLHASPFLELSSGQTSHLFQVIWLKNIYYLYFKDKKFYSIVAFCWERWKQVDAKCAGFVGAELSYVWNQAYKGSIGFDFANA